MMEQLIEKLKSIKCGTVRIWKTKFNKIKFDYILENIQKYQKHKLEVILDIFYPTLTVHSSMVNDKFLIIYGFGNLVIN